jgi:subtilisin family serine protease
LRDQPVVGGGVTTYHGTHVAGIAAGNGAQNDRCTGPFTYIGVAPQADLVVVKTGVGGGQPNTIQNITQAAQFIFGVAARAPTSGVVGKPCVINISLGGHFGAHNGHDDDARAFDTITTGPLAIGRVIVLSAGNDRNLDLHAAFPIAQGTTQTVRVNLVDKSATQLILFGSYNPNATLTCLAREPSSGGPAQQSAAAPVNVVSSTRTAFGTHDVVVSRSTTDSTDPDAHFFVWVRKPAGGVISSGVWEFDIAAGAGANANVHLWVTNPSGYSTKILPFPGAVASAQDAARTVKRPADWIAGTLTSSACSRRAITVAAYNAEETTTPLAEFSAQGPAPNNLMAGLYSAADVIAKPDIAAPGVAIDAPRGEARKCCLECDCCVDRYVAEQGTSMSSPHIAGVVALMLARNANLTADAIKQKLRDTARAPPPSPPGWPPLAVLWGAGKVDAKAAAESAVLREAHPAFDPAEEPTQDVPTPAMLPASWPDRLRSWSRILSPHPAWNLCAALVSQHFDEVKRLIDTNRRVAAVWQRHGGPALVRNLAFAERPPDPPVPVTLVQHELFAQLFKVLMRFGGEALRADIVRHGELMYRLPGASWSELDAFVMKNAQP